MAPHSHTSPVSAFAFGGLHQSKPIDFPDRLSTFVHVCPRLHLTFPSPAPLPATILRSRSPHSLIEAQQNYILHRLIRRFSVPLVAVSHPRPTRLSTRRKIVCLLASSHIIPKPLIRPDFRCPTPGPLSPVHPTTALRACSVSLTFGEYPNILATQMSPGKRGSRQPRVARARADGVSHEDLAGQGPSTETFLELIPLEPTHANEETDEMETQSNALMSTPQAGAPSNVLFSTAEFSRPLTRSAKKGYFDSILVESPSSQSEAQSRLRLATTRNGALAETSSHLEEAEDIDYGPAEEGSEQNAEVDLEGLEVQNAPPEPHNVESGKGHPTVGGLHICRRSNRIRAQLGDTREPSPLTALSIASSNNRIKKKRKRNSSKANLVIKSPRRSPRLAKPLDIFHKFLDLPPELQLMVWEAAVEPRLAYICNRYSTLEHAHNFGIQNKTPSWFMACKMSAYVARRFYQKLFGQSGMALNPSIGIPLCHQDINPSADIVIFEPCHNGCRAYYCAQQYRREDRAVVQRLAVQIDSPHLPTISEPGWVTISRSWPNVHTLYMMKPAVKGPDQSDKAMLRIKEGDHELALRKLFEAWKKGVGQDQNLTTLEFVRVVEQEPATKKGEDRYRSVEDRKTGLVEDIVLG
ncbi:hypothetical protein F4859DRAFT_501177 [Xylaria cf. heliscus]|nr:hypothetical protein F4859DRAFT_501177 [Xylaria cf. heliscus]